MELRHVGVPAVGQLAGQDPLELGRLLRVGVLVRGEALVPLGLGLLAAVHRAAEVLERLVRDEEGLLRRPAVDLLRQLDLLVAEWRPVGARGVLLVRRADRDVGADDDQRRLVLHAPRLLDRTLDAIEREVLAEVLDVPAVSLVALADVL